MGHCSKVIMHTTQMDMHTTVTHLQNKLLSLEDHIQAVDLNIVMFNQDMHTWEQFLLACVETSNNLLVNLLRDTSCVWIKTSRIGSRSNKTITMKV